MGLTTVPVGEPVPKRTLRGMLVGAEGFTSSSTPFAVPFKLAFDAALPATRFTHIKCNSTFKLAFDAALPATGFTDIKCKSILKQDRKNQDRRLHSTQSSVPFKVPLDGD